MNTTSSPVRSIPPLFAAFDAIRIINLAHRADRRREMSQELERVGLQDDERVSFFPAVACDTPGMFHSKGAHGCFLSHVSLLREAAENDLSLLILEDDCQFRPEIWDIHEPVVCDVFYGGFVEKRPEDIHGSETIIGSHMMGFSAKAAKLATGYFEEYVKPDFPGDDRARSVPGYDPAIRPPIDGGYVWFRRANPGLVTQVAVVSDQRASRSDITPNRFFDRIPLVRDVAEAARRWRRRSR